MQLGHPDYWVDAVYFKYSQSLTDLVLCVAVAYLHEYRTAEFGQEPPVEVSIQFQ